MEGHLEIRSRKLLEPNKKFWFVLRRDRLEYYNLKEDVVASLPPLGCVMMKDLLDVRRAIDQRNTLALLRHGQESLLLKVKDGQMHNWLGSIREGIFSAREGDDDVVRKPKKKFTRALGERNLMKSPVNHRLLRSNSDLSHLLGVPRAATHPMPQLPSDMSGLPPQDFSQKAMRSRKFSGSASSVFSGTSGSRGSNGRSKKKPRLPVSGFTGRVYLANEMSMVDKPEIITNEDFEYIVQAERALCPSISVIDETDLDVLDGKGNIPAVADEDGDVSSHVTFNSTEDVSLIEIESRDGRKKLKKEKKMAKNKNETKDDMENDTTSFEQNSKIYKFGWFSLRKRKKNSSPKKNKVNSNISANLDTNMNVKRPEIVKMENKTLETMYTGISGQIQDSKLNEIQLNVSETTKQNSESTSVRPRFLTDSQIQMKSEVFSSQQLIATDTADSPAHIKRNRLNSVSSTNSRDSASSIPSGMKEKILNWKRESSKSPKTLFISNPLELEVKQTPELSLSSGVNEQIDKIAQERLTTYKVNTIDKEDEKAEEDEPPKLPKKPLKFQISQLERLLNGNINPPNVPADKSEVILLLDSLRVMQSLQAVSCQDQAPCPLYDVPRRCYD
eukprot:GFUD01013864.1.p1 GENE.GFUD01013864.1~~GFUD01013864.1.p1  ORF type:complete len:616 (+),score=168.02 GFUD01013864.1:45-1892(+)